jgi:hypothetical protein
MLHAKRIPSGKKMNAIVNIAASIHANTSAKSRAKSSAPLQKKVLSCPAQAAVRPACQRRGIHTAHEGGAFHERTRDVRGLRFFTAGHPLNWGKICNFSTWQMAQPTPRKPKTKTKFHWSTKYGR